MAVAIFNNDKHFITLYAWFTAPFHATGLIIHNKKYTVQFRQLTHVPQINSSLASTVAVMSVGGP